MTPGLPFCADAIAIAAEHIVNRIKRPGDDLDALRLAARAYLQKEVEANLYVH